MNKKIIKYTIIIFSVLVLGMGIFLIHLFIQKNLGTYTPPSAPPGQIPVEHYLLYPGDPQNDRIILGASHNVFIGKVITQTGNKETEIGPRTQYQVQVIGNIKGELADTVTVDMLGGYDKEGKPVFVEDGSVAGEDPLFQPGSTYVFATRYNAQEDWYTVIAHPNARKVLSTDHTLPEQALRALAEKDEKVKKFEAAYVSEILDKADVANNNTRNEFTSLPEEKKAAAQSRADAAKASLVAQQTAVQ